MKPDEALMLVAVPHSDFFCQARTQVTRESGGLLKMAGCTDVMCVLEPLTT